MIDYNRQIVNYYDLLKVIEKTIENLQNARSEQSPKWNDKFRKIKKIQVDRRYDPKYNLMHELSELLIEVHESNSTAKQDRIICPYGNMQGLYPLVNLPKPLYDKLREAIGMDARKYQEKYYSASKKLKDLVSKNAEIIKEIFDDYYQDYARHSRTSERFYFFEKKDIISIIMRMGWEYDPLDAKFFHNVEMPFNDKDANKCLGAIEVKYNKQAKEIVDLKKNGGYSSKLTKEIDEYIKVYNQQYIYYHLQQIIMMLIPSKNEAATYPDGTKIEFKKDPDKELSLENAKYTIETLGIIDKWLEKKIKEYQEYLTKKHENIMKQLAKEKASNKQTPISKNDNKENSNQEDVNNNEDFPRIVGTSDEVKEDYKKNNIGRSAVESKIPSYVYSALEKEKIDVFDKEFIENYYLRIKKAHHAISQLAEKNDYNEKTKIYDDLVKLGISYDELLLVLNQFKEKRIIALPDSVITKMDFNSKHYVIQYLRLHNAPQEEIDKYLEQIDSLRSSEKSSQIIDRCFEDKVSEGLSQYRVLCEEYYKTSDKDDVKWRMKQVIVEYDLPDKYLLDIEKYVREKAIKMYGEEFVFQQEEESKKRK